MASDINIGLIGGRLGADPERKGEGGPVTFRLASNRWVPGREGKEGREDTSWMTVVCWGPLAERVETTYQKGDRLLVEGRIQIRQWEDPDSGKTREGFELVATTMHPLGDPRRADEAFT
jgi:single-strand DNA-binding protein